jgi:hypothetical protein
LDLGFIASLDLDSRTIYVSNVASENLRLRIYTLEVKSDQRAGKKITVLNHHTIVSLRDNMHSSLLEVGEPTIRNLNITIDGNGARCLIRLITYEITAYQVDTTSWETD